jgi:hypothetical protein
MGGTVTAGGFRWACGCEYITVLVNGKRVGRMIACARHGLTAASTGRSHESLPVL